MTTMRDEEFLRQLETALTGRRKRKVIRGTTVRVLVEPEPWYEVQAIEGPDEESL